MTPYICTHVYTDNRNKHQGELFVLHSLLLMLLLWFLALLFSVSEACLCFWRDVKAFFDYVSHMRRNAVKIRLIPVGDVTTYGTNTRYIFFLLYSMEKEKNPSQLMLSESTV